MATRRELLLAATGGWLIGRVRASDGAGTVVEVEPLAALPTARSSCAITSR